MELKLENIEKIDKELNKMTKDGNIQQAIDYCKKLLDDEPANTNLHVRLGDLYLDRHLDIYQAKQFIDEAVTEYQKAAEVLIDNSEIYYKIATALYYKGEYDKAINYYNIAIEKNGNKAECYYMISDCLQKKDRFQDALEYVELALKSTLRPSSKMHYAKFRLLNSLYFSSRKKRIVALFELILSWITLPFDKFSLKKLKRKFKIIEVFPQITKADALINMGDIEQGLKIYTELIDRMPGYSTLYVSLGDTYRRIGKLDEAVVEYKMALWLDQFNRSAYTGITSAYEEMGDYESAIAYYKKYLKIHPYHAGAHSNIANLYFMTGDTDEAITHYQAALTINPKQDWTSLAAQTLGFIHQNTKNIDSAIACYQMANVLTPKEIDIYISLGSAFYDNQDYKNALIVYRRALELDPKNSKIHCNLGYLYWGMGNLNEAIKEYELSIKYDPEYDIAQNNLGVIYLDDLLKIQDAIEYFRKAIACNPNYALAYYNLGRCYELKNEKIEAAKYFQQAMDINNITNEIEPADIQDRLNNLFS